MADAGRFVVILGVVLLLIGGGMMLFGRFTLPGDFVIRRGDFTLYAPLATSLIISIVLTVLLNLLIRSR